MAILDKPDIQLLVDAYTVKVDSVIVANGVGAITGPILNDVLQDSIEILTDIKDSYYNLLSETRTALSTTYSPAIPASYNPLVTESKAAHDQSIARIVDLENGNYSNNIAYVAKTGSDILGEYELGNPAKPFLTINAGITAVPVNGIVKVLGGAYTEEIALTKEGVDLDISGCSLIGRIFINKSNISIIAIGATITNNTIFPLFSTSSGAYTNFKIIGGTWDALNEECIVLSANLTGAIIRDATFISNIVGNVVQVGSDNAKFKDCFIEGTNAGNVFSFRLTPNTTGVEIENSTITSNGGTGVAMDSNTELKIRNCKSKGNNYGVFTTTSVGATFNLIAEDSTFLSTNIHGAFLNEVCDNVRFTRCIIITQNANQEAVNLSTNRTATKDTLFEYCTFFTGVNRQVFAQNETDTSVTYVNNCNFNKLAFAYTAQLIETGTVYQPNTPLIL